MILNLKSLNQYIVYHHFEMDSILTAVSLMKHGCFMASLDLKDAYYSVSIAQEDRKYFKFVWRGKLYTFMCFPNGLALCPRKFTKLLKPGYSTLWQMGHLSVAYTDDSYLQGGHCDNCFQNVMDPARLFVYLGSYTATALFRLQFRLNFNANFPHSEKAHKGKWACQQLLDTKFPSIRQVAQVLGLLTSSFPGVMCGPLHYRWVDIDKTNALHQCKGNFDRPMSLSPNEI